VKKFENTTIAMAGHSMGGSIATKATERIFIEKGKYPWHTVIKGTFK